MNRRHFVKTSVAAGIGLNFAKSLLFNSLFMEDSPKLFFKLSLAQWSLHNAIEKGVLSAFDFPEKARAMGFEAVEYVSRLYDLNKTSLDASVKELDKRSKDSGIRNLLIMVDGEGALSSADRAIRHDAVDKHKKWVEAAASLGCHSIRVNLYGGPENDTAAWKEASADGLESLAAFASASKINVIVENHGGLSSNAAVLAEVLKNVNRDNCGTLPDFGNFCIRRENEQKWPSPCIAEYDRYKGVEEMMPFAKGVSAKSYDFDVNGDETTIDYKKMLRIVKDAGYNGYIGIEYEGQRLDEEEGIKATRDLLLKVGAKIK